MDLVTIGHQTSKPWFITAWATKLYRGNFRDLRDFLWP